MSMKWIREQVIAARLTAAWLAAASVLWAGDTGTDPAYKYAWGENTGWANARSAHHEVTVHYHEATGGWLSGHAWGENIGWIVMGNSSGGPYFNTTGNNWGVNLEADGKLSGYAWGENIGWIRFEQTRGRPAIDPDNGEFSGHAWGENIGWLNFEGMPPGYGVRTLAFATQPRGTPNWWLKHHGVTEEYDAGDGIAAWRKYVMDADPTIEGDCLRITAVSNAPSGTAVVFAPASTRRYYTLTRRDDLTDGGWSNVAGQASVRYGSAGAKTMQDTNVASRAFYSVNVTVAP